MALTLSTALRNAACDAIVDTIDQGSGAGKLKFYTSGAALLVTLTFSDPAFGGAAAGVATANAITDGTATGAGTADNASITDSADTVLISGLTVATSAANINLSSVSISINDVVSITSMTVTMPAS